MTPVVRRTRPGDAPALCDVFRRSIEELGARDYSAEQVRAWTSRVPTPEGMEAVNADGRVVLVAVDTQDAPFGFMDLEADGHIDRLYRAPDAPRGVADALLEAVLAQARCSGIGRLHVEASEAARRFFERHGFRTVGRRDFTLCGVAIHNYAMERPIDD
ncbi:MAG: GNAT family N-acetyltransferase [Pseudomonadota bacterium]